MSRPRYPRSNCCVPFCRRTSTLFKAEWLCADHWRLVDRQLKRFRTRRLGEARRDYERYDGLTRAAQAALGEGGPEVEVWRWANKATAALARWDRLEGAVWARMKRQAISRAAGAL